VEIAPQQKTIGDIVALNEGIGFDVSSFEHRQCPLSGDRTFPGIGFGDLDPEQPLTEAWMDDLGATEPVRFDGCDRGGSPLKN
jgi:hypothetical protein